MDEKQTEMIIEGIRRALAARGQTMDEQRVAGLRQTMADPKAFAEMARISQLEARSVQVGQPAFPIDLPRLDAPDQRVDLSTRWASRPVALIFGSYT